MVPLRWIIICATRFLTHPNVEMTKKLAVTAGLEPATPCLEGRCSIRLSYVTPWVQHPGC